MKLQPKLTQKFMLETDPEGEAYIVVRQASQGETRRLAELTASQRQVVQEGPRGNRIAYEQDFNVYEERSAMIYLTADEIGGIEGIDDKKLFSMIKPQEPVAFRNIRGMGLFQADLDQLHDSMVAEMTRRVLEVNPQWAAKNGNGS